MMCAEGSFWKGVSSLWHSQGGSQQKPAPRPQGQSPEDDPHTIHIFTIASGHMYERLQKIMVLSVLRKSR